MAKYRWRVDVVESERGWGSKVVSTTFFDTVGEALAWVKEYNSANDADEVPAWYMYATTPLKVQVD